MRERSARIVVGVLVGLPVVAALATDLPAVSGRRFWSDAATYRAMAASLAFDHDLTYDAGDLARTRATYPGGPQGVFLKRVAAADGGKRLVYAKSAAYPLAAAPLVRLLGVDRGLLLTNGLALAFVLGLGYAELRRRGHGPWSATLGTAGVVLAGVTPVYLFWTTPELLNLAVVTGALVAWLRRRPLLAALLLGFAAYSKPYNVLLALPLLLGPLVGEPDVSPGWGGRLREATRRGLVLAAVIAVAFGLHRAATGEMNYQGGERKTFYDRYPGDPGVSFDSAGVWMTTDHLGPLVLGRDEAERSARVAPPRAAGELLRSFQLNLGYFWIGRFGGALPYFPGVVLAAVLFLARGPRSREGWLALAALLVSWLFYITEIPDNWYGGAGTIGNRYFVNLVPLGLLLLPRGRGAWVAAGGAAVTGIFLLPILAAPVRHSLSPGEHTTRAAFRRLPAELTMLGDLSVFTDVWRRRRPYNAPGGDPGRRPPGSPPPYFLWFLDDGTFGQETSFGEEGFWLRGGHHAQVVLQALARPPDVRVVVTAGPAGDIVTLRLGRTRRRLVLRPLETGEIVLERPKPLLGYYGTSLFLLKVDSRYGAVTERDARTLGSFVRIVLGETPTSRP
jgi:hypothetical protein